MKKTMLLLCGVSAFLLNAKAQLTVSTNTIAPAIGAYDQYYLPGPVDEATNAMTVSGSDNATSGDNDVLTYVAADKASKGQTFTTGPNPAGYTISAVTVRHILWTNFLGNGTWMNIPSGASFAFRFGTISGANITSLLDTTATYSGSTLSMSGGSGTGIYFTFDLSGAGLPTLSPNTTYFFEIAPNSGQYFELHNTRTNATSYAGGTAFYGDTTAQLTQGGVVNLPANGGEFAFVAKLAPVGAPSVTAVANPGSASSSQTFTITATVTPGVGAVTNVSVDLSSIGGSASATLTLSSTANVYTNTFVISSGANIGVTVLPVTVKDNTPLTGTYGVNFAVLPSDRIWSGGSPTDDKWSTTNNWQGGFAPSLSGNNVLFAGTTRLTPDMDNSYSVSSLVFSNTAGAFTLNSSVGGAVTVGSGGIVNNSANAQTLNVPVVLGAAQTFNAAAGNIILNSNITAGMDLTTTGAGTLTFSSLGTNVLGNLRVSSGQLNISSGAVNVTDGSGSQTRIESNATVTVSGGTLNIFDGGNGWFPIGVTAGSTGIVVVAGGTINVLDHWGTEVGNESGAGVLTINSGTFSNNDIGNIGLLVGENGSMGGVVNLNGGTLAVNKISANAGGSFFLNGGTLKPLVSRNDFWNNSGVLTAAVRNGGAIVDTSGFNIAIGQTLLHSTVNGDASTDGGLTKIGDGSLTLSGGYQYTGPTIVLGGTLSLNFGLGVAISGGDLVISNATLSADASSGISMPVANVALDSGALVVLTNNPGSSAIVGSGNLLITTNTSLNFNYGTLGGNPGAAAINVAGSMSVAGTNNIINITGSGFGIGEIPLLKYGSGALSSITGLRLGSLPSGVNGVLTNDTVNQMVALNITFIGQNLTWYGTNSLWDVNGSYNWNSATAKYLEYGVSPNVFGDLVTFDDTLFNDFINPQATNVNLTTTLHPSEITVNSSLPYTFDGAGSISGGGSLYQNGSGSLTLLTSNNYSGGTYVNLGTLIVTNDSALGTNTGTLTLNGGTIQYNGTTTSTRPVTLGFASIVDVSTGAVAQLSGNITGGTALTKLDEGTLTLSPSGTDAIGDVRLTAGRLNIASGTVNITDNQGSATRIENNAMLMVSGGTLNILDGGNGWFPIGVTGGATGSVVVAGGTINVLDHWGTEVGNESGAGLLTINSGTFLNNDIGNVGFLIGENGSGGGIVNLNGGTLVANKVVAHTAGGTFYFNGGALKPIASSTSFWANAPTLTAAVRDGGAVVDTAGFNVTIGQALLHSAVIGDKAIDGGLTKIGAGTLVLSGTNSYTGNTKVNGGTLEVAQSFPTLPTNSTVTIVAGSQLKLDVAAVTNVVTSLILNGIASAPGVYSSANGSGYITGSGYLQVLTGSAGPSGPAQLTNSVSGSTLTLSWPAAQGWRLQVRSNLVSGNWVYVTDGSANSTNITMDAGQSTMFYRLAYP